MNRIVIILFILTLNFSAIIAQNNQGDLEDIEVVIQKDKDIVLPRANRNYQKIQSTPDIEIKPSERMQFGSYNIGLSPLDPSIRINKLKPEPLDKLYGNYLRGAFGNYTNTFFEAYLANKREDKGFYNVMLSHNAFGSGPVDESGSSINTVGLNAGVFLDDMTLSSHLNYDRRAYNFYGFENDSLRESFRDNANFDDNQVFDDFNIGINLNKNNPSDYLRFDAGLDFNYLGDQLNQNENLLHGKLNAEYDLNIGQEIGLETRYLMANYNLDSISSTRHLFEIAPTFTYSKDNLKFKGGIRMSYESDTSLDGELHFYPVARIDYSLMDGKLIPFAGVDGGIRANTLNSFRMYNPFIQENLLSHSNKSLEIYGGSNVYLGNRSKVMARVSLQNVDNLPVMLNNPLDQSKFLILYSENSNIFNAHIGINSMITNRLETGLSLDYFSYNLSDSLEAWHLPEIEASLMGRYNINDKIYVNVDIFFINGIFAYTTTETKMSLDPIFDLNLKLEYLFSNRISSFVEAKNILSNNYQRFLYYDSRGIQLRAGLTYSF